MSASEVQSPFSVVQSLVMLTRFRRVTLPVSVLSESRDSILDFVPPEQFPTASYEQETQGLRTELGRLMEALYHDPRGPATPGSLKAKLQSFVHPGS